MNTDGIPCRKCPKGVLGPASTELPTLDNGWCWVMVLAWFFDISHSPWRSVIPTGPGTGRRLPLVMEKRRMSTSRPALVIQVIPPPMCLFNFAGCPASFLFNTSSIWLLACSKDDHLFTKNTQTHKIWPICVLTWHQLWFFSFYFSFSYICIGAFVFLKLIIGFKNPFFDNRSVRACRRFRHWQKGCSEGHKSDEINAGVSRSRRLIV